MRVIVSDSAADFIEQQGGHVYVWLKRARCCGSVTTLATSSDPPKRKLFERANADQEFDLYLDASLSRLPDELHFDVRRFPRRLEAYWNGCAWVI
jgi:Ni,Fe-hydrogenase I small subunit